MILADILATPISAWMMQYDIWLPYILGTVIIIVGSAPILFLPETLEEAKAKKAKYRREAGLDAAETDNTDGRIEPSVKRPVLQEVIHQVREFKDSTQFIWRNYSVCLVILCLLVTVISRQSTNVLLQFTSKKFNWTLARVCLSLRSRRAP